MAWWLQNQWSAIERVTQQHSQDSTYYTETFARRDQVAGSLVRISTDLSRIETKLDRLLLDGYQGPKYSPKPSYDYLVPRTPEDWKNQ